MGQPVSITKTIKSIRDRLDYADRRSRHRDRNEPSRSEYWGNVSPTCPPSKKVMTRAGWFWSGSFGDGWWANAIEADLGPGGNCEVAAFANVGSYKGIIIHHVYRSLTSTESAEYGTAKEAIEGTLDVNMAGIYSDRIPLALIIVKNNGSVGTSGAILQIDRINRGNSFIYRQFKPWLHSHSIWGPD